MTEKEFQDELQKALDAINALPKGGMRDTLMRQAGAMKQQFTTSKDRVKQIQDSIDLLRVHTKYLIFDLEATRRENTYLRQMLDEGGAD
jgi:hypothetical protein